MPSKLHKSSDPNPEKRVNYEEAWFEERVAAWQKLLGVDEYDISVIVKSGLKEYEALCKRDAGHLTAVLKFRQDAYVNQAEYNVVHELIHVMMAQLQDVINDQVIGDYVPSALQQRAKDEFSRAEEALTERLAHAFVRVQGGEKAKT